MARIEQIHSPEQLPPEARPVFDAIQGSRGAVRGPFSILLHRPAVAAGAQQIGAYLRYESPLPDSLREGLTAIVARLTACDFEWSAHAPLAATAIGESAVASIRAADFAALPPELALAAEVAVALVGGFTLDDDLFARARERWGDGGLVEVVSLVGYYTHLSMVLNAFAVAPDADMGPGLTP
jgi:4-carboxymuconolactone decarboxylase